MSAMPLGFSNPFTLHVDGSAQPCTVAIARTFVQRALGLLGKPRLRSGQALWIDRCGSIHTVGMHYAIDAVFLDGNGVVLRVCSVVAPLRFRWCAGAKSVLELSAGQAQHWGLVAGSRVTD